MKMLKKFARWILRDDLLLLTEKRDRAEHLLGLSYSVLKNNGDLRPALTNRIQKAIPHDNMVKRVDNPKSYLGSDFVLMEELTAAIISTESLKSNVE